MNDEWAVKKLVVIGESLTGKSSEMLFYPVKTVSQLSSFELFEVPCGKSVHLADGDGVETLDAVALG